MKRIRRPARCPYAICIRAIREGIAAALLAAMLAVVAPGGGCAQNPDAAAGTSPRGAEPVAILAPDRVTTWNPGLNAVGGIPNRSKVCATVDARAFHNGSVDASARIQSAIHQCPAGEVVQLSPGTFRVDNHLLIDKSITLRGAGPQATFLVKSNGAVAGLDHGATDAQPIIVIGPARWPKVGPEASAQPLVADGVKGALSVTIASGRGYEAGQFVLLDVNEYDAARWTALPPRKGAATATRIFASDRVVFMRHDPPTQWVDDPFPQSLSWFSRAGRPIAEVKEIAAVTGNVITFTTPLHIEYPVGKAAQLTRFVQGHVKHAGVEDLAVQRGSDGAIRFEAAAYAWVRNVECSVWTGEGIAIGASFRIEVRDSYIHDAAFATPGGGAYAISFANGTSDSLVENNIIMNANKMMVARSSGAGSVVAYNYADNGLIQYDPSWQEVGLNGSHMAGSHGMLFEGNASFNYDSDNTHGNAIHMTVFRNHLSGFRRDYPGLSNARAAGLNYGSWWHSFVGNVMGLPDRMQGWVYENIGQGPDRSNPFGGPPSIWKLGYQAGQWEQAADPKVLSTVIRDGNFDYVTEKVQWQTLARPIPASLYLTAKPAFFGTLPWPWVDATGAVKLHTLPAKARFEAGTPFARAPGAGGGPVQGSGGAGR